jgi:hypothetical protein
MNTINTDNLYLGACDIYADNVYVGISGEEDTNCNFASDISDFFGAVAGRSLTLRRRVITKQHASVEFSVAEVTPEWVAYVLGKNGSIDSITQPGVNLVNFGGLNSAGNAHKIDVVGLFPDSVGNVSRHFRITLWAAQPEVGTALVLSASKWTMIKSTWTALDDGTRAAGSALGQIQIEKLVKS